MKKRCIAILFFWVLLVSLLLPLREKAHAFDPLTDIAAASFAVGQSYGMVFSGFTTAANAQNMMISELDSYLDGRSSIDVFGSTPVKAIAGKLAITQLAYNEITNFLGNLADKYSLSTNRVGLGYFFSDNYVEMHTNGTSYLNGWYMEMSSNIPGEISLWTHTWKNPDGRKINTGYNNISMATYPNYELSYLLEGNGIRAHILYKNEISTTQQNFDLSWIYIYPNTADRPTLISGTSNGSIASPTVLYPGVRWEGNIGAEDPDTNLDQLIGKVFQDVKDTNLDVESEVVPDSIDPPQPVPTWAPVDDVIDGINQTGEKLDGIGNDIGDISSGLDDLGEQMLQQQEALEGIQEGIADIPGAIGTQTGVISGALDQAVSDVGQAIGSQTGALSGAIADNAGVVSGAIDQAVSDVQTAIGEQTATLDQTLTETAEVVQDIAEALQPGELNPRKFDLRGLFPFCIPFDIHNLLQKFQAAPVAPHVQLPFVIQSIGFSYMIDLDFSAFDTVASALRTVEFIVFAIGLAWATSKVIKW